MRPPRRGRTRDRGEDGEGKRGHATPTHAVAAAVLHHLLRRGVLSLHAKYLIGHGTDSTTAAYVPEASPETAPI